MTIEVQVLGPAPLDSRADQVMVPMRDGIRLATDVYLPARRGAGPTVLIRLPYDKCSRYTYMPALAPHFTERGYVLVVQDVRGKFRSEGETVPFIHEVEDGYDTLEWIVRQSWSNSVVGMFGDSYYGFTQWAALASGHPALRAMVPRVTGADLHHLHTESEVGVPHLYFADYLAHYWVDRLIYDYEVEWPKRPLAEAWDDAFAAIGARSAGLDAMLAREAGTRLRLEAYPNGHPFGGRAIPTLHSAGWFDNLLPASMADYRELRGRRDRERLQYLVADSTDHENYHLADVPITPDSDHDTNDEALARMIPSYLGPALEFFDIFLSQRGDVRSLPMVRWHLGNEGWHDSPQWPPEGVREVRLFPADATSATRGAEGGALSPSAENASASVRWLHEPGDLVPSTVVDPYAFLREYPDEREVQKRDDVVAFTGEASTDWLDLVGPLAAFLRVGSTGPSMHVFAKLLDVAPGGEAHMLARGQTLVVGPDPQRLVRVDLNDVCYRLLPGHRLRLQVSSSDYPLYLWHPGTEENPWFASRAVANEHMLTVGGPDASYLSLSVRVGQR